MTITAAAAAALTVAACGSSKSSSNGVSGTINGAGSTLAAPIYQQWGSTLKGQGVTVNYQAVGSGAGVAQWTAGTADFAGSDPSLKPADKAAAKKGTPVQIPMAFGAITVSYNLPGVATGLKLDGATIANMFLGKIKTWNDPAIAALNPGVKLPSTPITIVHRSDESGTTKGFTTFLVAYSPVWGKTIGADKTVKWPLGTGAKGNSGVAAAVKQTVGAVGYVESAFALQNKFTFASVKNKTGAFVAPTLDATTAAGEGLQVPPDLGISTIDAPSPKAYPITSQTFIDVYQDPCKAGMSSGNAAALVKFLNYGLGAGQAVAKQLNYAPLPASLLTLSKAQVTKLTCKGSPIKG